MDQSRKSILIVDDDAEVLMALERLLETQGYRTTTAWSGHDALRLLQHQRFDLLLLDQDLPDVNCDDLLQRAKGVRTPARCVVMQPTGTGRRTVSSLASPTGIHGSVCKWEHDQVVAIVRDCLGPAPASVHAPRALPALA
jgi:CheY-like chemotaxis protein